ncbi:MAG TPA: hypothetical protein VGN32_10565 [Ktedonobacterales bacterium]|jgi:L-alanine-DL-glutamate epimerase-like enolase superfamily enzyme|nr:hypothetical protein [Ktedonobacterales bacterium]
MASSTLDRDAILRIIRDWSPDEQLALAQAILQQMGTPFIEEPLAPPDSRGLAGLIANGHTPPTDEEVARWLDEQCMEQYGKQRAI